jgi:hypothetical protein
MKSIIIATSLSLLLYAGAGVAAPHTTPATVVAETTQFEWDQVSGNGNGAVLDWEAVPADNTTWSRPADTAANTATRHRPANRTEPRAELKKPPLSAVPEPSIASMLLVGLVVLTLAGQSQKDEKFSS